MKRILDSASWVVMVAALALAGTVSFWLVWPDEVVTLKRSQFPTNKTRYAPGEYFTYTLEYCKTRPIAGTVYRALVNGSRINYETIQSDLPVGCHEIEVAGLRIPPYAPPGVYHVDVLAEYQINPIRKHIVRFSTTEFLVAP